MHATSRNRFRLWATLTIQCICCIGGLVCYLFFLDTPGEDAGVAIFLSAWVIAGFGLAAAYTHTKIKGEEVEEAPFTDLRFLLFCVAALCLIHFFFQPPMSGEDFQKWMDEFSAPEPLSFE